MKQPKKVKPTLFLTPPTENPVPKFKMFFFLVQTRLQEFFEGSYSSLAYSSGELSRATVTAIGRFMHFLILGVKWFFCAISLVPDIREGQARALSTREIISFPNKVWSKILTNWIRVQGLSKFVKKTKTPSLSERLPGEPLTQINIFFLIEPRKLAGSVEGLNNSLAIAASDL